METINSRLGDRDGETNVSIARGGPIYVPNLVGPLTRVPDFESALFHELQVSCSPYTLYSYVYLSTTRLIWNLIPFM